MNHPVELPPPYIFLLGHYQIITIGVSSKEKYSTAIKE